MTQKKKKVFSRKSTDHLSLLGLLKKSAYSIFDCFPEDQQFATQVELIKAELKEVEGIDTPLVELLARADRSESYERIISFYLILMNDIVNPKGMKLICMVICIAMTINIDKYAALDDDTSENSHFDENDEEEMQIQSKKTRIDYIAEMTNDIYTQVVECHISTKITAVYTIKLLCTFLYKFDFSSQTVAINRMARSQH
jgi:hypothetical protein